MKFIVFLYIIGLIYIVNAAIVPHNVPPKSNDEDAVEGLYDENDKVTSLTNESIKESIYGKTYGTILQFYNSFCGHCRRFAPHYKSVAKDIFAWRNVLKVMAIDCAVDDNNDVCREFEIMGYPSLRYFSPNQKEGIGRPVVGQEEDLIKSFLIASLVNETNPNDNTWPDFSSLNVDHKENIFDNIPENVQYTILVYEPENTTLGSFLILQFSGIKEIKVRRTTSSSVASHFNIESYSTIAIIDRNLNIETVSVADSEPESYVDAIRNILSIKNIHDTLEARDNNGNIPRPNVIRLSSSRSDLLHEVINNKHLVYQADLELALRFTIFHEIPKFLEMDGERLLALQHYINILSRYHPLGSNGHKFLEDLQSFVHIHNQELRGEEFQVKTAELEKKYFPVFSSGKWVGCQPSKPRLRGFSCGLWQLFHYMTVRASEDEASTDPLEVLQAIHGYVKNFFGCSGCSNHFQAMAARNKIWSTSSKDNAVLWLWSAHNEVNKRLAGDETEDPEFPKVQFPIKDACPECIRETTSTSQTSNNDIEWNKTDVLLFLKRAHNPQNISRLGVDDDSVLPSNGEKLRSKRMITNVFSDIDMRMGILLYMFCIGMMFLAVKLFLRKGYRKKTYSYDFLGKV